MFFFRVGIVKSRPLDIKKRGIFFLIPFYRRLMFLHLLFNDTLLGSGLDISFMKYLTV